MTRLTYNIKNYPTTSLLNKSSVDKTLREAFSVWARVTPLTFTQRGADERTHIGVSFLMNNHGGTCGVYEKNVVAHATYPNYLPIGENGEIHFNDAINWTVIDETVNNLDHFSIGEDGDMLFDNATNSTDTGNKGNN